MTQNNPIKKQIKKNPEEIELTEDKYIKIKFGYDSTYIFPYIDGIDCLTTFANTFLLKEGYREVTTLEHMHGSPEITVYSKKGLEKAIEASIVSNKEYKAEQLLKGKPTP